MKLLSLACFFTGSLATCDITNAMGLVSTLSSCVDAAGMSQPEACECLEAYQSSLKDDGCADDPAFKSSYDTNEATIKNQCGSTPTPAGGAPAGGACDLTYIASISSSLSSCQADAGTSKKPLCKCYDAFIADLKKEDCDDDPLLDQVIKDECGGCFPATSTVELESGNSINLDQLQLGDKVRVGPSEFSEVYFFSTEMADTTSKFVKLATDSGAVTMTQGHYLYVNGMLKVASDVQVGDNVVLGNGTHVAVNEVTSVWAPGLYNPHTLHGDIVVDGIRTSTYTDAVHPTLAHALMSPLRTMYSAGISFGKKFRDTAKSMPSWLREAIEA